MARPLRLEFENALYHITSRGDGREAIYLSDADREIHLQVLADVCERFNWQCHAYCQMGNHYHLLVATPDANLSKGMRHLNGVYTQRFNRQHHRVGHVFQGRYKAIFVEQESYFLEVARYIVLNPVRAHMVKQPEAWPWSSYLATAGLEAAPSWLVIDSLLQRFSEDASQAIRLYRHFVADKSISSDLWGMLKSEIFLGSDSFAENLQRKCEERHFNEIPRSQLKARIRPLPIDQSVSRNEAIVKAWEGGGYTMEEIGQTFGLHYSQVSRIIAKARCKT